MASLFQDDLHSSDSEDDDYIPDKEVTSDDEDEESLPVEHDEIGTKKRTKKIRKEEAEGEEGKLFEEKSPQAEIQVDQKQRADDLFKSFLAEVETEMKMKEQESDTHHYSAESSDSSAKREVDGYSLDQRIPEKTSLKMYDFAGETISVSVGGNGATSIVEDGVPAEKVSHSDLEKSKNSGINMPDKPIVQRKGLQSVLDTIMNKKSKMTTLQKTSLDWNEYKKKHGISEELQNYNKGRGGFIERKRFLERSDLRSYEIERDLRMSKRKKK